MIKSHVAQVRGRVQGVGFRYSAQRQAKPLGLRGWVRNEIDGSVTVRFEGPEEICNQYIQWLQEGPSSARVTNLSVRELNPDDRLNPFEIIL